MKLQIKCLCVSIYVIFLNVSCKYILLLDCIIAFKELFENRIFRVIHIFIRKRKNLFYREYITLGKFALVPVILLLVSLKFTFEHNLFIYLVIDINLYCTIVSKFIAISTKAKFLVGKYAYILSNYLNYLTIFCTILKNLTQVK